MSEETKRKISEANKGLVLSEEQRNKIRQSKLGKPRSLETREKMSLGMKGRVPPNKIILPCGFELNKHMKIRQLARKYNVSTCVIYRWKRETEGK